MVLLRLLSVVCALSSLIVASPVVDAQARAIDLFPLYGYATLNGGTTGGKGGKEVTVTTAAELTAAIAGDAPKVVYIKGTISVEGVRFRPGANTSILGIGKSSGLTGSGFTIIHTRNVILRNLVIQHVVGNDAITIQNSTNVWVDHNEFFSDLSHGFDYYDGAVDIIRGSDYITVSHNYFHDHWKNSLVGNNPDFASIDSGFLRITYYSNYWNRVYTRTPALRFGHAHVVNNLYKNIFAQGVHTRSYGQALVEFNTFVNATEALSTFGKVIPEDSPNTSPDGDYEPDGFANIRSNDWNGSPYNVTAVGNFTKVPYWIPILSTAALPLTIPLSAGVGKIIL